MAELVVTMDGSASQRIRLVKERTVVGRRHLNDLALSDISVSGVHCAFERTDTDEVWVQDMDSTNGTYVNGIRVNRCLLKDRDRLLVGIYRIEFRGRAEVPEMSRTTPLRPEDIAPRRAAGAPAAARLRVISGPTSGLEVPLVKAVTTFGKPGIAVMAVYNRIGGYYVAMVEVGKTPSRLDGQLLGGEAMPLPDGGILELAGTRMQFILA
jgi:pSer/pThr/pTyr-binding forkhead associated (FHA) protein